MGDGRSARARRAARMLRRLPYALFTLGMIGALSGTGALAARRTQELAGRGAVEQPGLTTAHAQGADGSSPSPAPADGSVSSRPDPRLTVDVAYTSLDVPDGGAATARIEWDDEWFTAEEAAYNHDLARAASVLAALAYSESGYYQARVDHPPYMERALSDLGFDDASTASYRYRSKVVDEVLDLVTGDADGVAYTIARKRLNVGGDRPRDLILVSARGSYGSEWLSNLDLSRDERDDHGGYARAAREISAEVIDWAASSHALGAGVSVLLVGHSRGGAIANLVAAELDDYRADALAGNTGATVPFASVYAYTFAAPATTLSDAAHDERYANIFNIANPSDIMPYLPLAQWGYARYGVDLTLPGPGTERLAELERAMHAEYERTVGVACVADAADAEAARAVCDDIAGRVATVEELVTPAGALAVAQSAATHVSPVRMLHSHFPSTYICWLVVADASQLCQLGTGTD